MSLRTKLNELEKETTPQKTKKANNLPKHLKYLNDLSPEEITKEIKHLTCQDLFALAAQEDSYD